MQFLSIKWYSRCQGRVHRDEGQSWVHIQGTNGNLNCTINIWKKNESKCLWLNYILHLATCFPPSSSHLSSIDTLRVGPNGTLASWKHQIGRNYIRFSTALVDLCEALVDAPKQQGTKRAHSAHHALLLGQFSEIFIQSWDHQSCSIEMQIRADISNRIPTPLNSLKLVTYILHRILLSSQAGRSGQQHSPKCTQNQARSMPALFLYTHFESAIVMSSSCALLGFCV